MGIGITLAPFLKITIDHAYYRPAQPGLELRASHSTQLLLKRSGCRLRTLADGVELYASAPEDSTPQPPEGPGLVFSFWLETIDPDFWTVTQSDWDGDPVKECLFFSERPAQNHKVLPDTATVLPVRRRAFHDRFEDALSGEMLSLVNWRGGDAVWSGTLPQQGQKSLDLALNAIPDGRYSLLLDGRVLRDFYLSDRPPPSIWGMLEIDLNAVKPPPTIQEPTNFQIVFNARHSRWRYVLRSLTTGRDLGNATITGEPDTTKFTAPKPDPDGRPDIWVIDSVSPIPLYAAPAQHHRFTLNLPAASGPAPAPIPLPLASADGSRMHNHDAKPEMWSTIYVTV